MGLAKNELLRRQEAEAENCRPCAGCTLPFEEDFLTEDPEFYGEGEKSAWFCDSCRAKVMPR